MLINEDIFGGGSAIEIIVRWHEKAVGDFNKNNSDTFQEIKQLINGKELTCYFLKVKDVEQRIIVPIQEKNIQLDIFTDWDEKLFSYKVKVKALKKTKVTSPIHLPEEREYYIEERCKLVFIDINDSRFPIREQLELFERVTKLEILPHTKIENDLDIWNKYVQAQDILNRRYSEPFPIRRYHPLIETKNEAGTVIRYKFKVDMELPDTSDYKEIEEELRTEFNIYDQFDVDGNILLSMDDIFRGLDFAIEKKFNQVLEREKTIACVLQIRPLPAIQILLQSAKSKNNNCTFSIDLKSKQFSIFSSNNRVNPIPLELIKEFGLKRIGIIALVKITDKEGNVRYENKKKELKDDLNPRIFEQIKVSFADSIAKYRLDLIKSNHVKFVNYKIGEFYFVTKEMDESLSEEFWQDLRRDLYNLDFKVDVNESTNKLIFYFNSPQECIEKYNRLKDLNKFQIVYSIERPDFKYQVKTNLIKAKTDKQLLYERIESLRGVDFQTLLPSKEGSKYNQYIYIGKLLANESDNRSLVFSVPLKRKDEIEAAEKLLSYLDEKPTIKYVEPNLKGDQAKIGWLVQAMAKLTRPSDKPNGKPVNDKLGQFIFDSSKAEEIFKDISPTGEEWQRVKANELLKVNDSQREAILAALHARDLCLLQGPPGTGKTTVIAELIWQLISQNQNQRILLTSETNLAVDNAIEKLLNKEHTLVKPLRFGKDTKFEEEGKKYSYNRIMKWIDEEFKEQEFEDDSLEENDDEDVVPENLRNNAVQTWMNRIASCAHRRINGKYQDALKQWAIELGQPEKEIRRRFADKYFKYANVVGSTCSSSGSGSFSRDYSKIFYPHSKPKVAGEILFLIDNKPDSVKIWQLLEEINAPKEWFSRSRFTEIKTILKQQLNTSFDVVIMDEASKATPPEMLLPLCFGKKSVIIGDHKQLPPMLNEKEFKEALLESNDPKAKALSEEIDREFVETSQFERLIMHPNVSKNIVARLNVQYRMHPKINNVIKQFYTGDTDKGLRPAEELLQNADDPDLDNPFSRYHGLLHDQFIKPDIHTIWINVDEPEELSTTSRVNQKEVEAVQTVLTYLKNSNGFDQYFNQWNRIKDEDKRLQEQEVGIISFYGHQVKKLQDVRKFAQNILNIPVRLKTVDKFQGMERNIVIVSTVRSNKIFKNGSIECNSDIGFAKAPERLNVALSRARRLLIIVGNLDFFESYRDKAGKAIYKNAINIIRQEGLVIDDYKKLNKYK